MVVLRRGARDTRRGVAFTSTPGVRAGRQGRAARFANCWSRFPIVNAVLSAEPDEGRPLSRPAAMELELWQRTCVRGCWAPPRTQEDSRPSRPASGQSRAAQHAKLWCSPGCWSQLVVVAGGSDNPPQAARKRLIRPYAPGQWWPVVVSGWRDPRSAGALAASGLKACARSLAGRAPSVLADPICRARDGRDPAAHVKQLVEEIWTWRKPVPRARDTEYVPQTGEQSGGAGGCLHPNTDPLPATTL